MKDNKLPSRKRLGIFIDYALRIPSFTKSYFTFKQAMFADKVDEFEVENKSEENDLEELASMTDLSRFFWKKELENSDIEDFYVKKTFEEDDYTLKNSDFKEFFYNEEHWKKFIEDYSFNIYGDADVPNKKDIDLLNITQSHLFDVILIDEYYATRKKLNTFFYLAKIRVCPQAVLFLGPGQNIDEKSYYGIWNPKVNKDQENKEGYGEFENWLKELEANLKTKNV